MTVSSGTRISEIEEYLKANMADLHNQMTSVDVPFSLVSNTDSLSLALMSLFIDSLDVDIVANIPDPEFEILKRTIAMKIAKVVIFAGKEATA